MVDTNNDIEEALHGRFRRLNADIQGIVFGVLSGLLLFIATLWLVVKGGEQVGPHLSLLGHYFPGYRVTVVGSFIGLAYGSGFGFLVGYLTARIYNALLVARKR